MKASEMLDLDREMTPADQWSAEDSENPVTNFKIPDTVGCAVEMLTVDAHGAVTMRRHWCALAKLVAACERRTGAVCARPRFIDPHYHAGCRDGQHVADCAIARAEEDLTAALAAVHATGADCDDLTNDTVTNGTVLT